MKDGVNLGLLRAAVLRASARAKQYAKQARMSCRACGVRLTYPEDLKVKFCKECYPPHAAPSCVMHTAAVAAVQVSA